MIEENESAPAEGEALPASGRTVSVTLRVDVERVLAALERWYAEHFHRAAVAGRAPITAADKASLAEHVKAALSPEE